MGFEQCRLAADRKWGFLLEVTIPRLHDRVCSGTTPTYVLTCVVVSDWWHQRSTGRLWRKWGYSIAHLVVWSHDRNVLLHF